MNVPSVDVLGLPIQAHTLDSLLARMEECIASSGCSRAYYVNAHSFSLARREPRFREALREAEILYADGASVLLAARVLGSFLPQKLTTTDVWPPFCRLAAARRYRVFLLGGEPGLAEKAGRRALAEYPDLCLVGTHHGYDQDGGAAALTRINRLQPDVVWVGMGDPRQVYWAEQFKNRLETSLVVTCGGLFKFISGEVRRAPGAWHRNGLEWLGRIVHEPTLWKRYARDLPLLALSLTVQRLQSPKKPSRSSQGNFRS